MYSSTTPIRSQVSSLSFGLHSSESIRSLSACEITSPVAFDNLGNALPNGLYDGRMGCTDAHAKNAACVTCGMGYMQVSYILYTLYILLCSLNFKCTSFVSIRKRFASIALASVLFSFICIFFGFTK